MRDLDQDTITAWLVANRLDRANNTFVHAINELGERKHNMEQPCLNIVLSVKDPNLWIGYALAGYLTRHRIWFCSPQWGILEWQQALPVIEPDLFRVDDAMSFVQSSRHLFPSSSQDQRAPGIMIPTGGSSGSIRFAWHTLESLRAAVSGMARFFYNREPIRGDFGSICRLPLWHVSGWMQLFRALVTDSEWQLAPEGSIRATLGWTKPSFGYSRSWLSLVPTQLALLLTSGEHTVLRNYDRIVIGGGPCPQSLLEQAWGADIHPWTTFGMTETAGMIAASMPDSKEPSSSAASLFPHIEIRTTPLSEASPGDSGLLWVRGSSCCLGYNGERFSPSEAPEGWIPTGDLGRVNHAGSLSVSGRRDRLIVTGGEKVSPEEVEAVLKTHPSVSDCHVGPVPDFTWGQRVGCLVVMEQGHLFEEASLLALLKAHLSPFKIPRKWIVLDSLPTDSKGKRNWRVLDALLHVTS